MRCWLLIAALLGSIAATHAADTVKGHRLHYQVHAQRIVVEYQDPNDFIIALEGGIATIVRDGAFYLRLPNNGSTRVVRFDRLSAAQNSSESADPNALKRLQRKALSTAFQQLISKTNLVSQETTQKHINTFSFQRTGALRSTQLLSLTSADLAKMQAQMKATLQWMDMSLCGNTTLELMRWWLPELHAQNAIVLANEQGLVLNRIETDALINTDHWIPSNAERLDFRVER
jgi:hypothetical protein